MRRESSTLSALVYVAYAVARLSTRICSKSGLSRGSMGGLMRSSSRASFTRDWVVTKRPIPTARSTTARMPAANVCHAICLRPRCFFLKLRGSRLACSASGHFSNAAIPTARAGRIVPRMSSSEPSASSISSSVNTLWNGSTAASGKNDRNVLIRVSDRPPSTRNTECNSPIFFSSCWRITLLQTVSGRSKTLSDLSRST